MDNKIRKLSIDGVTFNLPNDFMNEVSEIKVRDVSKGEVSFYSEIRSNFLSSTDCKKWIECFGKETNTSWIVAETNPNCKRYEFVINYDCQLSSRHKKQCSKRNAECKSKVRFILKRKTKDTVKKDKYVNKGLCGLIKINFQHSHLVNSPQSYRFLRTPAEIDAHFQEIFCKDKCKVASALREYKLNLEKSQVPGTPDVCPSSQHLYYVNRKVRKKLFGHIGGNKSESIDDNEALPSKIIKLESKVIPVKFPPDKFPPVSNEEEENITCLAESICGNTVDSIVEEASVTHEVNLADGDGNMMLTGAFDTKDMRRQVILQKIKDNFDRMLVSCTAVQADTNYLEKFNNILEKNIHSPTLIESLLLQFSDKDTTENCIKDQNFHGGVDYPSHSTMSLETQSQLCHVNQLPF